jgi:hypothetical protein
MTLCRSSFALPLIAVFLLGSGTRLAGLDSENSRPTLKGITEVAVVVEDPGADAIKDGLTIDQLQTDVELRLRKAGIKVSKEVSPYLYVNAHLLKSTTYPGLYAYHCEVSFQQRVTVMANGVVAYAATWSTGGIGIVGQADMKTVRDDVGDLVDSFLNAYLSVNPK